MKSRRLELLFVASMLIGRVAFADTVIIDSELSNSYHFVDTYEVLIDQPPDKVWPHLVDLGSWMYEFSMIHESGPRDSEGAVFRLYEGQDYFMQVATVIPERLLVAVNLPSSISGEELVGIGMLTLTEIEGKTLVSNLMTRQSVWIRDTSDTLRERRESAEFQESARDRWNRFMARLRELAEGTYEGE